MSRIGRRRSSPSPSSSSGLPLDHCLDLLGPGAGHGRPRPFEPHLDRRGNDQEQVRYFRTAIRHVGGMTGTSTSVLCMNGSRRMPTVTDRGLTVMSPSPVVSTSTG